MNKMSNKSQEIPIVGNYYYFFDDGKTSPSRCYKAKVLRVIPYSKCNLEFEVYDYYSDCKIPKSLKEIHKEEVDNHRQTEKFTVHNGADTTPGKPWLYAEETDFFIECNIPNYDTNTIWFARTINGGWFSIDIQNCWQSGRLDIDGSIHKDAIRCFDEMNYDGWYDNQLKDKGDLI